MYDEYCKAVQRKEKLTFNPYYYLFPRMNPAVKAIYQMGMNLLQTIYPFISSLQS